MGSRRAADPGAATAQRDLRAWQARLDEKLRANIVGDLAVVVVGTAALLVYFSWWAVALIGVRLAIATALFVGRRLVRRPRPLAAMGLVLTAHLTGVIAATAILPEFAPLTALIAIGDVQFADVHLRGRAQRRIARAAAGIVIALVGALSCQRWTGLGQAAPSWLVITFVIGQGVEIAVSLVVQSYEIVDRAAQHRAELVSSLRRLAGVEALERRALAQEIARGPRSQLLAARRALDTVDPSAVHAAPAALAVTEALSAVESAIAGLRSVAHGLGSAEIGSGDLLDACSRIDWSGGGPPPTIHIAVGPAGDRARHAAVLEIIAAVARSGLACVSLRVEDRPLRVIAAITEVDTERYDMLMERIADLAGAAGGEAVVARRGATPYVQVHFDEDQLDPEGPRRVLAGEGWWAPKPFVLVSAALIAAATIGMGLRPELVVACTLLGGMPVIAAPAVVGRREVVAVVAAQQLSFISMQWFLLGRIHTGPPVARGAAAIAVTVALAGLLGWCTIAVQAAVTARFEQGLADLQAARTRVVRAGRARRREIERDLHDGAQQFVVAIAAQLRVLQRRQARGSPGAADTLAEVIELAHQADAALQEHVEGAYPAELERAGLVGALSARARRSVRPVSVVGGVEVALPPAVELAGYFCAAEALQNVDKHAGERASAVVDVRTVDATLRISITDDGAGFDADVHADTSAGHGLSNLSARVDELAGHLTIQSTPGAGCEVRIDLPIT